MLKKIEARDRIEMLADHIEHTGYFDMTSPDFCIFGHCRRLFADTHPIHEGERPSEYVARLLGVSRKTASGLYQAYPPGMPFSPFDAFGPMRSRAAVVRVLRELAA